MTSRPGMYVFTILDEEYHNVTSGDYPRASTPTDFLVYFTMYFVQVYDHDLEWLVTQ